MEFSSTNASKNHENGAAKHEGTTIKYNDTQTDNISKYVYILFNIIYRYYKKNNNKHVSESVAYFRGGSSIKNRII